MRKALNPRRYDALDVLLSCGLFLVALVLLCMVIEREGQKMQPPADLTPLDLGMN